MIATISAASIGIAKTSRPGIVNSKTEPGDENNQDISSLVGKVDIRKQNDPDAYSYSGSPQSTLTCMKPTPHRAPARRDRRTGDG